MLNLAKKNFLSKRRRQTTRPYSFYRILVEWNTCTQQGALSVIDKFRFIVVFTDLQWEVKWVYINLKLCL